MKTKLFAVLLLATALITSCNYTEQNKDEAPKTEKKDTVKVWQMNTHTKEWCYSGSVLKKFTERDEQWEFKGTELEAKIKCTTNTIETYEYPYNVLRTYTTTIIE